MSQGAVVTKQISSTQTSSSEKTTSSSSTVSVKTSHQSSSVKSSSHKMVTSTGAQGSGLDVEGEIERMKVKLDQQMTQLKIDALNLLPIAPGEVPHDMIKLDHQSIKQFVDESHKDTVKFNFDVSQFQEESVVVKSDGNKIEVHAKKRVKKGDDEQLEEYCRTYEMPSGCDVQKVTSSLNKDAHSFTVELPIMDVV